MPDKKEEKIVHPIQKIVDDFEKGDYSIHMAFKKLAKHLIERDEAYADAMNIEVAFKEQADADAADYGSASGDKGHELPISHTHGNKGGAKKT